MEISIKNDFDFFSVFPSDEACIQYLEHKRWNGKPKCPSCGNSKDNWFITTRKVYKCSDCRKQFSVIQGTIFQSSKIGLRSWFYSIFLLTTYPGYPSTRLAKRIGVQQRTAWLMLQKIRETMRDENSKKVLSGIVECDEAYLGSKPRRDLRLQKRMTEYKRDNDREYEHLKAAFGIIDRYSSQIVIRKFGWNRNCLTTDIALHLLKKHVTTISTVNTDEHPSYFRIPQHFHSHHVIRKNRFVNRTRKNGTTYKTRVTSYVDGKTHVNGIENVWKHLQDMEKAVYKQFSYKHAQRYFDEFSFRWNRRTASFGNLLVEVIDNALDKVITYGELAKWNNEVQTNAWLN
ncbi:MAG: IS1595 family transposase [Flavobacteriales bacterium]|nr:IS1595 family transposase [Flavobacteriales bacterium]